MQENFRQSLYCLRQTGELVDLQNPRRQPPSRYARRPGRTPAPPTSMMLSATTCRAPRHHQLRERAMMALAAQTDRELQDKPLRRRPPSHPAQKRSVLAGPRGALVGERRRPYNCRSPCRPSMTAGRRSPPVSSSRAIWSSASIPASIVSWSRKRRSPASTWRRRTISAVRAARARARRAAADLDLDRHPSHRYSPAPAIAPCSASTRRRSLAASAASRWRWRRPDRRRAVHRRCRDRARGRGAADRLDISRRPLRRVHPADGRAALESAGAHQGDLDAQGRDRLNLHMPWENTGRGADALCHVSAALRTAGVQVRTSMSRLAARVLARGDLDQEAARRGQERAARRIVGDGLEARRRG